MSQDLSATPNDNRNRLVITPLIRSSDSEKPSSARQGAPNRSGIRRDSLPLFSVRNRDDANYKDLSNLHPYVQSLTIADLESCIALENSAFPPEERCSPEKFSYRLSVCPELCLGIFSTCGPEDPQAAASTYRFARAPNSAVPLRKAVLLGHIIATKSDSDKITHDSLDYPQGWQSTPAPLDSRGHQDQGRTIALHSLAVLPAFRNRGLGSVILKSFKQRMQSSGIADRVSLIAHEHLIKFYQTLGFVNKGASSCTFGAETWFDLVYEWGLSKPPS